MPSGRIWTPGVYRGSHSVRGGGNGMTLPYWVNFDDETVGQTPDRWAFTGVSTPKVLPTVVSNYQKAHNPNRKCLHFNTDVTNKSDAAYTLPGAVDVTGGIRFVYWMACETDNPADWIAGLWDKSPFTSSGTNGIRLSLRRASPYDVQAYDYINDVATLYTPARSVTLLNQWFTSFNEWFPATGQLYTRIKYTGTDTDLFAASTITLPNGASLASAWSDLNLVHFYAPAQGNQYYRDLYVMGFWIGAPTDAWPATSGPPTGSP